MKIHRVFIFTLAQQSSKNVITDVTPWISSYFRFRVFETKDGIFTKQVKNDDD